MKYFLLLISIAALLSAMSCQPGKREVMDSGAGAEITPSDGSGEIVLSRAQFESMGMVVGDPAPRMFSNSIAANGYVEASPTGSAKISSLMPGRVRQINHTSGDVIRKGQTIFSLESNEIILLQQMYAEAFQHLKLLEADYERLKSLASEKIVAQKDFLRAKSEYKSNYAKVEGLRARLKMIHIDPAQVENGTVVPYLSVRSPINGTITRQALVLGQHVEPNETPVEVVDTDQLRLSLQVFEKSIAELVTGQHVRFSTPDQHHRQFTATLSHIGKSVSRETRTVECFATIRGEDLKAFVNNMFVEATIVTCEREALAIPEHAIIHEPDRDFVLVLLEERGEQMIFRKIPVQTGVTNQGYTEILEDKLTGILLEGTYNLPSEE